ncbi:MAG: hypothetical protein Q9160_000875 [Pyrenula sp. 1 TL-2023]
MASQPNDPFAPKGFFDLPPEVRELIYLEVLQPHISWDTDTGCCRCGKSTCIRRHPPLEGLQGCHKLLCLNRHVKNECQPILDMIPQDLLFRRRYSEKGWDIGILRKNGDSPLFGLSKPYILIGDVRGVRSLKVDMKIERETSYTDLANFMDLAADLLKELREIRTVHFCIRDYEGFGHRIWDALRPLLYFRVETLTATLEYLNVSPVDGKMFMREMVSDILNLDFEKRRAWLRNEWDQQEKTQKEEKEGQQTDE